MDVHASASGAWAVRELTEDDPAAGVRLVRTAECESKGRDLFEEQILAWSPQARLITGRRSKPGAFDLVADPVQVRALLERESAMRADETMKWASASPAVARCKVIDPQEAVDKYQLIFSEAFFVDGVRVHGGLVIVNARGARAISLSRTESFAARYELAPTLSGLHIVSRRIWPLHEVSRFGTEREFDAAYYARADADVNYAKQSGDRRCILSTLRDANRWGESFEILDGLARHEVVPHWEAYLRAASALGRVDEIVEFEAWAEKKNEKLQRVSSHSAARVCGVQHRPRGRPYVPGGQIGSDVPWAWRECTAQDHQGLKAGIVPERLFCAPSEAVLDALLEQFGMSFKACMEPHKAETMVELIAEAGGSDLTLSAIKRRHEDAPIGVLERQCVEQSAQSLNWGPFRLRGGERRWRTFFTASTERTSGWRQ